MVSTRYRYEVTCTKALFQQLALLITHGYTHWVSGVIPPDKDPREIDAKLLAKYEINVSGKSRVTAKKKGRTRLQYLRLGRLFVIAATPDDGHHIFFEYERKSLRSFKTSPFKYNSHSISLRNGHPHVRIPADAYKFTKRYFTQMATIRSLDWWHRKIWAFPLGALGTNTPSSL